MPAFPEDGDVTGKVRSIEVFRGLHADDSTDAHGDITVSREVDVQPDEKHLCFECPITVACGKVGKKKQGYKARKDESIAMRIRKKRTKKQLKASRDESYGRFGSKAKKSGKINR